jgi:hypothetical protein
MDDKSDNTDNIDNPEEAQVDSDDSDIIFVEAYRFHKSTRQKKDVWTSKRMQEFTPSQRKRRKGGWQKRGIIFPWTQFCKFSISPISPLQKVYVKYLLI